MTNLNNPQLQRCPALSMMMSKKHPLPKMKNMLPRRTNPLPPTPSSSNFSTRCAPSSTIGTTSSNPSTKNTTWPNLANPESASHLNSMERFWNTALSFLNVFSPSPYVLIHTLSPNKRFFLSSPTSMAMPILGQKESSKITTTH